MTKFVNSREFNQDISAAKRAADRGPVVIRDRGTPAYVLLRYADYEALVGQGKSIIDLLDQPDGADFDFEFPKLGKMFKDADFD
jgi:Antitoxin Phd_YefM, type II toxin-antitoxin system